MACPLPPWPATGPLGNSMSHLGLPPPLPLDLQHIVTGMMLSSARIPCTLV